MTGGFLLAIEGIDGSGKRSVSEALSARARSERGMSVSTFTFPDYESLTGRAIAEHLRSNDPELTAEAAAVLFAADRLHARERLTSALARGELVIVDRYVASNAAYQAGRMAGASRGQFASWVERLEYGLMGLPRPALTLLLDVAVADSRERTSSRSLVAGRPDLDHYEASGDLLTVAAEQYRSLATAEDWHAVDASAAPLAEVIERCWSVLDARLGA